MGAKVSSDRWVARDRGVDDLIETLPALPYRDALHEMRCADGLLVAQASDCNQQIPGKVYEYFRAGRPILCLSDLRGDTAGMLRSAGVNSIVPLDSADEIAASLVEFIAAVRTGHADLPHPEAVRRASRTVRAESLATLLDRIAP
jgi:hypothetical protein